MQLYSSKGAIISSRSLYIMEKSLQSWPRPHNAEQWHRTKRKSEREREGGRAIDREKEGDRTENERNRVCKKSYMSHVAWQ